MKFAKLTPELRQRIEAMEGFLDEGESCIFLKEVEEGIIPIVLDDPTKKENDLAPETYIFAYAIAARFVKDEIWVQDLMDYFFQNTEKVEIH